MDLSRLSNDDLAAIANNDLSKVSDKGLNYIIEQDKLAKELAAVKPDTGFTGAFKAGKERLKGDIAALAGRTGIMDTEAAEQYRAKKERLAERMFTPTEEGFAEAPFTKFKELLGGSLPYAAGPLIAGVGAATLPVSAPAAAAISIGGAGLASLAQFTGSNLSRQMQEDPNLRLADTSLSSAAAAAAPQAALDVVSFRMMPGIGKIFGAAGKEITPEVAKKIAEQGIIKTTGAYGAGALKTAGIEGTTEAGQQFLERLQAGLNISDQQARDEYFDSFIGGAVLGGTLGVPGTYLERGRTIRQGAEMEEEQKQKAIQDRQKAQQAAALAEKQQLQQTAQNLGVKTTPLLPAPEQRIEMPEVVDPLIDPLGRFKSTDLSAKEVAEINKRRIEMGKPRIGRTFSIEDLADVFKPEESVAAEGVLNRLIASRTGYTADQDIPAQTLTAAAQQRGIDTTTQGFRDFLIRTTGTDNLDAMSPPQRLAVAQAIKNVKPGDETRILESGLTNAKYYTPEQYNDTLKGLSKEFKEMGNQENGISSVLKQIEKYSGLKQEKDQRRILDQAVKDGLLERNVKLSSTGSTIETFKPATDMQPLPGGMDIRKETFKQGEVPESYELRAGARVLSSRETQEEADRDAAAFEQKRQDEIVRLEKEVQKLQKAVAARNAELTQMQALGQDQSNEFFIKSANYYGQDMVANTSIADLRQQQQGFADPVQIVPVGTKPVAKDSFTFYEKNKPQVRFDTEEQAEQYGISRLNDETLQQIVDSAASQKQTGRVKRYTDLAQKELDERQSIETERGIAITTTKGLKGNKERLEGLGIFSKEVQDNVEKLRQSLLPALKRFGLENVALRVIDSIENGTADGYYVKQVMAIAMDSKDPMGTLRHESIHALKELGAFTDQEWKVLTNKAKSEWVQKFIKDTNLYDAYKDRYEKENGNLSGFDEYIYEEAIAEAFRNYKPGNLPAGMIGNIWVRLNKLMEALRNAFSKLGFQTTDDIFTRIEEGEKKPTKEVVSEEVKLSIKEPDQFSKDAVETNNWKASPIAKNMAEDYAVENGITPYLSEGQISVPVDPVKYSIKPPSDDSSKNDPTTGLFLNKNGSVTLYYPTTAAEARRINNEKKIAPSNPNVSSIYLTNESSGWKSLGRMGDEYQVTDGSVVRVEIDPSLLQIAQEYEDGRKEFYVPVKEGEYFNNKMRMWAMYAERSKPIPLATKYSELGTAFERSLNAFKQLNESEKRARTKEVKEILKREHNIGKLLGENGKLEKTRVGDYGITYDDKSVASLGLGLASAQKLNDKTSTCPVSAICEGLCLGDTSGNNMMYGGMASGELAKSLEKTSFRAGPRLSQYLKTEAMMVHPEEFVLLLDKEIKAFKRWADKNEYLPAIRLNVTSDIPPKYLKPIMDSNPEVIFYDYTKLDSSPVADNHHLTYSSTGVSQTVGGDQVVNKEQNWDRMKRLLDKGSNVAMAFTSKSDMPSVVVDEVSGKEYQVWNGDNYDARFLDPKRNDGVGMIVGLTNKAATLKAPTAAKETNGFFIDYDKVRDGDRVVIQDQSKFAGSKVIPITKIAEAPKVEEAPKEKSRKLSLRSPNAWYYSQLEKGIEATPDRIFGKASQVKAWLTSNASKMGVKSEELQFSGINDWLDLKGDEKVSKEDVLNYLKNGGVRLEESDRSGDKYETRYEDYQLDGGTNYREMLITLPSKLPSGWSVKEIDTTNKASYVKPFEVYDNEEIIGMGDSRQDALDHAYSRLNIKRPDEFRSTHFQAANILAHIRMNDRKDPQGNKVLFIEEIQSDWHQTGRKRGYATPETGKIFGKIEKQPDYYERGSMTKSPATYKVVWDDGTMSGGYSKEQAELKAREGKSNAKAGVPNAPFKDTKAWTGLALKRIIAYASENNYDKVAFINGEQSAERYDLSKQLDKVVVRKYDDEWIVEGYNGRTETLNRVAKNDAELADTIGKELADKAINKFKIDGVYQTTFEGIDLKVGGKGMINYYDNILPQVASDVLKKIGGSNLEKITVPVRVMVPSNVEFKYTVVSDLSNDNAYVQDAKTGERVTTGQMSYDDAKDWLRANDPATSNPQTGFSITEKIREKVGEGIPLFSLRSQLPDSLNQRIAATTTKRKQAGFVERLMDAISPTAITKFRQGLINKYESIEQLSRLRGEQFGEKELLAETSAIAAALQSDRAAGVAASSFRDGIPVFDKGYTYVTDKDSNGKEVKGLIPILEPLMKYNDPYIFQTFQFYAGTRRGRRLDAEGREKTFTKEDIAAGKDLEKQFPEFATVFDEYQKYNAGLVKYMMDTGVISPQEAKIWTQNWDYIPFYRQLDGEKTAGPKVFSPIAGVAKPKKLKGSEAPLDDFMETIVRNARAAIEAGMKNEAARRVIRDVVDFDLGERLAGPQSGNDIVTVKENGMTVYYRVDDPLLVESLKGLNLPQLPFMTFLSAPADLLRNFVTKDPGFILANLGRDSMQAWITSGTNMMPLVDTFKQFGKGLLNHSPEAYALARSGLTGYDFAGDVESTAKKVEQELRKRTGTRTKGETALLPITAFWDMLGDASTASDMATRAEVYKRTLERTGSEAEAFYQAMEVINFSRKGNSALIRILSATIPFFNARVQGLDVLYRTGFGKAAMANKDKIQKAFIFRSMVLLGTSVMYWAMVSDDEDYKRLSEEERDNYWIIPGIRVGDKPFRFPIPFELGVLFKVLPERVLEYSFGSDTGKDLRKSLLRNAMSTLSFNPIPQAVLPIVENVTNYSFFTGEPVVGRGVEGLAPPYQYGAGTSVLARQMGEALNYSPQKIDNFIRGYTGTLGTYAMMMLDSALEQEGDPPRAAKRMEQMPIIKRFFASNTGTVSAYYDLKEEVDTVVTTVNMLQRTGNSEDLKTYLEENKNLYGLKSYVATLDKNMKQLNQATRLINASKTMSSDEKREALDKINDAKIKLTERVKLLRKGYE